MEQTIVDWLNWLRLRASEQTVAAYGWQLRRLVKEFPRFTVRDFKEKHLTQYLAERRFLNQWSDSSVKMATWLAVRSFFGWVSGKKSAARGLLVRRVKTRKQRSLTFEQLGAVLAPCDMSAALGKRNVALVALMVDTGLRSSEVCRLRLADLDLAGHCFRVVIKGGGEEEGIFTPETGALLATWLAVRPWCEAVTVFTGVAAGKVARSLTPCGLRCVFRNLGVAAGLAKFSPHDLRRTFATLSTERGAPSRLVQEGGRWSNIQMVERYTRTVQLAYLAKFLPMSGMMGG